MTEPAAAPTPTTPAPPEPPRPLGQPAVWRLILCAILFIAWMLYLALLVLTRPQPATGPRLLSRPQALVSKLDVVATIDPSQAEPLAVIQEVLYPASQARLVGQTLEVTNLRECGTFRDREFVPDIQGPGSYLLLLNDPIGQRVRVTPLPPSPGFSREYVNPRAYLATPDILAQYRQVEKPSVPANPPAP